MIHFSSLGSRSERYLGLKSPKFTGVDPAPVRRSNTHRISITIALPRISYLDGATYHDAVRNPINAEPDRDLRQLFANNRALPLEVL